MHDTQTDIDALMLEYPLPDGTHDAQVNRQQLGLAFNVSENTITKYLARGMPCIVEGGNGKEYSFSLAQCYAWRRAQDAASVQQKELATQAALQMSLHFRNSEEGEDGAPVLTAKQVKEEAEAEYVRNRAAEQRGELTRARAVAELFEDVLGNFRISITTVVDFCEMEFGLTPEQTDMLQRRTDQVLVDARIRLDQVVTRPADVVRFAAGQRSSEAHN